MGDSPSLPLNISRETLQSNTIIKKIKTLLVKKVLNNLRKKASKKPEEYLNFFKNFGEVMKEGLCGNNSKEEKEIILELCRFRSINEANPISLDLYIDKMLNKQKNIYFLNGENINAMKSNPQIEGFKNRSINVILLADYVDNFWVNVVNKYKNKELKSITNNNINLDDIKKIEKIEKTNKIEEQNDLIKLIKETLEEKVKEIKISSKLVNSPACISTPEGSINLRMEKFLKEQKQLYKKTTKIM